MGVIAIVQFVTVAGMVLGRVVDRGLHGQSDLPDDPAPRDEEERA